MSFADTHPFTDDDCITNGKPYDFADCISHGGPFTNSVTYSESFTMPIAKPKSFTFTDGNTLNDNYRTGE